MSKDYPFRSTLAYLIVGTFLFAGNTSAQVLEEVTVTATKRAESMQDVPISIQAVGGEEIEGLGITNFEQIEVPGFKIPRAGMGDNIFMRGIGSGPNLGFEQSVPIYMGGLYFGRGRGTRSGFLDLERIEIVKGPQPIFFGKNAIAGAANLVWRRPTAEFEGYLDGFYEFENQEIILTGVVSGPLTENLRGRLAVRYRDLGEGWLENTTTGNQEPELQNQNIRATLEWDITDSLVATATLFHSVDEDNGRNQQMSACPSSGPWLNFGSTDCVVDDKRQGFNTFTPIGSIDTGSEVFPFPVEQAASVASESQHKNTSFNELDMTGGALELLWETASGISVTSVTGYYEFDNLFMVGGDQTPTDRVAGGFTEIFDQFSQELRFQSDLDQRLTWLGGFYYDSNDNHQVTTNVGGFMSSQYTDNHEKADSWAFFAEVKYELTDQWRLSLGGRYTEVDKDYTKEACRGSFTTEASPILVCGAGMFGIPWFSTDDSQTFSKFQPAVGVEWDVNDDSMVYGSYKEGFKAGGWDFGQQRNVPLDDMRFDQEEVEAFELGTKMRILDGAATLNIAVFSSEYTDLQVTSFDTVADIVNVRNAGSATSQGVEVEFAWAATESITLKANVSYLDSNYDYFISDCPANANPENGWPSCDNGPDNDIPRQVQLKGEATSYAPDWSGNLTIDWYKSLASGLELNTKFNIYATTEYFTSQDNDRIDVQDGYAKLDLRIGLGSADGRWEVAFVGRNLTDEITCAFMGDVPASAGPRDEYGAAETAHFCMTERPRTLGIQGVYRF